jgi:hypothetical protein
MAQFLYDRHSTNVHLNIVNRHIRLARQIKGAEELVTAIEPSCKDLAAKVANTSIATAETEYKRDLVFLKDTSLDDKVRDVNDSSKKYDRDFPGLSVNNLLFPDGTTPIIYAPFESEPSLVENLILGIQSLGQDHPLTLHIAPLQAAIDESKAAIGELGAAIKAEKTAEALEAIAKLNLTRQYEQNIYTASSKFGKAFATRLFPVIKTQAKDRPVDEPANPAQ